MREPEEPKRELYDRFREAIDLPERERRRWLDRLKADDPGLGRRLEQMLAT